MKDLLENRIFFMVAAYATVVGLSYEWGYWGQFNVNILDYMSFGDVLKSASYPFALVLPSYLIAAAIDVTYPTQRTDHFLIRTFSHHPRINSAIIIMIVVLCWKLAGLYRILGVLFAIAVIGTWITYHQQMQKLMPNSTIRALVVMFVLVMPWLNFFSGWLNARDVLDGTEYNEAKFDDKTEATKLVGQAGSKLFLIRMDNTEMMILNSDDVDKLRLVHRTGHAKPLYLRFIEWLKETPRDVGF